MEGACGVWGVIYLITDTLMVDVYSVVGGGDCRYLFGGSVEGVADNVGLIRLVFRLLKLETTRVGTTTATVDVLGLNHAVFNIPCIGAKGYSTAAVSGVVVLAIYEVKLKYFLDFGVHD
jgi:hypothetical protein